MFLRAYLFSLLSFCLFFSCNSNPGTGNNSENENVTQVSTEQFFASFPKVTLPVAIPAEANQDTKLDQKFIESIFSNKSFIPAFGESKDVPDLADNAGSAKFYAEGIFRTDAYTAVIIRKAEEDTYYYLSTFAPGGEYLDGICIAFTIGNGQETERKASINDDFSIQIRQSDKLAENPAEQSQNVFMEITGEGKIQKLNTMNKIPALIIFG